MRSWGFPMNNNEWLKSEIARLALALQWQKERAELALQWQKERAEKAESRLVVTEAILAELEREVALLREKIKC